ncbi:hypothetical protein CDL15_Pgr006476 [Punica granatum]|uniref:Uncharacterized protein n=1 Tax=Punica granatum TaxID=22663 RepID=A0A218XYF1_PUNGR|nr:hypothetical protein CDL15_Pgr006476 [Punica granatum]
MSEYRNMELPWFDQVCEGSSSRSKTHKHQDLPLPPKKRFCIKSSLTAWRPDPRQQLILDDLWASIKNPQKGEESINALVLHIEEQGNSKASLQQEEQGNSKASLQQELCLKIDSLQQELSLQKAQTHAFLQNRHILEFSIPRISFYVFPLKDKFYNHHFDFCDLLKYGVLKSIILRPEDEHRLEYQSLFGNNAWDLIKKSLHRSSSLFISIESSPPEWISPINVQPAIHYIFISPVSSRSVLTPEAKFWLADGQIITEISKWRAWVQANEWHWRKYPEHILQFSGISQRVFLHISLIDMLIQPRFSTRHDSFLDKFEEEFLLDSQIAHRQY